MKLFTRNLIALLFSSFFSVIVSLALNKFSPLVSQTWYLGILFFIILSFILNLIYAYNAGSKGFTELLLATIVIKLLLALIFVVVYSFIDKPGFFSFSIQFVLQYILFTVFEVRYLLHIIKTHPPK